jgi:hypothetical protein
MMRNDGKALLARNAELEAENDRLRELTMLYLQIAFREGFRAALLWVPDQWNAEAHILSTNWVNERRQQITVDLAEPPTSENE